MIKICFVTGWLNRRKCVPLIIAANRDEEYDRGGEEPKLREGENYSFIAPRDPRAGGTWIGINSSGVLAALTNNSGASSESAPLSRGRIVADILKKSETASEATKLLEKIEPDKYRDFSLVTVDPEQILYFSSEHNSTAVDKQTEGSFFLSNRATFELFSPREVVKFPWGSHSGEAKPERLRGRLQNFCRQHRSIRTHGELCRHEDNFGTVSSSIILMDLTRRRLIYDFAAGAPCETTYYSVDIPEKFESSAVSAWENKTRVSCQND
ncbi:MAG: NRDE family protein [bacterium]